MDLLSMLTGAMTSDSSVSALSQNTGASSEQTSSIISAALPILMSALTSNASSEEGAQSLAGALNQHTSTSTMAEQLQNADAADGEKIIEHILGGNASSIIEALSGQTGASSSQVSSTLNNMAPAMMSGLSAAATTSASSATDEADGLDLSSLMNTFGGNNAQAAPTGELLGGLFGNASSDNASSGGLGELVGGLFGNSGAQPDEGTFNGSSLLSLLGSFMKQ